MPNICFSQISIRDIPLALTEKSVRYLCMRLLNALSDFSRINNHEQFKGEIYEFLIQCEPCKLNEFYEYCKNKFLFSDLFPYQNVCYILLFWI